MGNTGTKRDLKEQAQRHCHAHSMTTTPLGVTTPLGATTPLGVTTLLGVTSAPRAPCRWLFQQGAVRLCHPALLHPSISPSLTPAGSHHPEEHPGVQGTHHRAQEGSRQHLQLGLHSMACPEWDGHQDLGVFRVKGLCTKPSRQPELVQRLPSSSSAKLNRPNCTEIASLGLLSSEDPQQHLCSAH